MNRFKEGDIIVDNGFTYVCELVGEEKSFFRRRFFDCLFKSESERINSIIDKEYVIKFTDRDKYKIPDKINSPYTVYEYYTSHFPVIGSYSCCGNPMLKLCVLKKYYPEEYKAYIKHLNSEFEKKSIVAPNGFIPKEKCGVTIKENKKGGARVTMTVKSKGNKRK